MGHKVLPETRAKLSEAARNRPPISAETRQKLSEAHLDKHHTAETRRKIGAALSKGGPFPYGPLWLEARRKARNRDNYTCQRCGLSEEELGHELSVHHIRPFRESKDNSLENLISLCGTNDNGCHRHCEDHPEDCPEPREHWLLKT